MPQRQKRSPTSPGKHNPALSPSPQRVNNKGTNVPPGLGNVSAAVAGGIWELSKILTPESHPPAPLYSDYIGLRCGLGIGAFKCPLGDFHGQPTWRIPVSQSVRAATRVPQTGRLRNSGSFSLTAPEAGKPEIKEQADSTSGPQTPAAVSSHAGSCQQAQWGSCTRTLIPFTRAPPPRLYRLKGLISK